MSHLRRDFLNKYNSTRHNELKEFFLLLLPSLLLRNDQFYYGTSTLIGINKLLPIWAENFAMRKQRLFTSTTSSYPTLSVQKVFLLFGQRTCVAHQHYPSIIFIVCRISWYCQSSHHFIVFKIQEKHIKTCLNANNEKHCRDMFSPFHNCHQATELNQLKSSRL